MKYLICILLAIFIFVSLGCETKVEDVTTSNDWVVKQEAATITFDIFRCTNNKTEENFLVFKSPYAISAIPIKG